MNMDGYNNTYDNGNGEAVDSIMVYANGFQINIGLLDCNIEFLTRDSSGKVMLITEIKVGAPLLKSLYKALGVSIAAYEKKYGPIPCVSTPDDFFFGKNSEYLL